VGYGLLALPAVMSPYIARAFIAAMRAHLTLVPLAVKVRSVEDVWTISASTSGTVQVTLRIGPPRPLAAVLTDAELASLTNVLPEVAEAVRRGEFSRIQLAAMFREAIGRDPFRQATTAARRPVLTAWWADVLYIVIGLSFAANHGSPWLRLTGWALAAIAFGDLVRHIWRRLR
jgi:hypothetical protein